MDLDNRKEVEKIVYGEDLEKTIHVLKQIASSKNISALSNIIDNLSKDKRPVIRLYAYDILFNTLKRDIDDYRDDLMIIINNKNEDIDLRSEASYYISSKYFGSKDKNIISVLYNLFLDHTENDILRATFFVNSLNVLGLSTKEISLINGKLIINIKEINFELFKNQVKEINLFL